MKIGVAIEVAIYRMGNWPGAKILEKWERKWKMAPRLKWPKNGNQNGKNSQNHLKIPFSGPLSILIAIFRPFRACTHFPFSFPFFRDFCSGQDSHSVNGHFKRKIGVSIANDSRESRCESPVPLSLRLLLEITSRCETVRSGSGKPNQRK